MKMWKFFLKKNKGRNKLLSSDPTISERNYIFNAQAVKATKNIVTVKHFFSSSTHCQNIFHVSILGFRCSYDLLTSRASDKLG